MLAVKFYSQIDSANKPAGIPDAWPCETINILNDDDQFDESWTRMTQAEYTAYKAEHQSEYDTWHTAFTTPDAAAIAAAQLAYVKAKISAARVFGIGLVTTYGASNVLAGLNLAQVQYVMEKTSKIVAALNTGSLYVAIAEINAIEPDGTIIKQASLTQVRNQIEDYLGIPRT